MDDARIHGEASTCIEAFSPQGDRLATVSSGGVIRLWDLSADGRPVADLLDLTRLLSGQQMHAASGSFVSIEVGNLRDAWPKLRTRFPAEFGEVDRAAK